jgi:hypothetical protein
VKTTDLAIARHALALRKAGRCDLHVLHYVERAKRFRFDDDGQGRRETAKKLILALQLAVRCLSTERPRSAGRRQHQGRTEHAQTAHPRPARPYPRHAHH